MSDIELKIGADPEFFLKDKETGQFVSAHGMVEGTKEKPQPVEKGAVQVDGMALEFNINPASTEDEFVGNITSVLSDLRKMVPDKYEFVFTPVAEFGKEYIEAQPIEAKRLGCTPDYNAWEGGKANPTPDVEMPFRTASGHIHIGWTEDQDIADPDHIEACNMLTKQLDVYLGCISGVWDTEKKDVVRRDLYGKAGAYRPKPYGVEYRVMSNTWLHDAAYMRHVYQQSIEAFASLMTGQQQYNYFSEGRIRKAINNVDVRDGWNINTYSIVPTANLTVWYNDWKNRMMKPFIFTEEYDKVDVYSKAYRGLAGNQPDFLIVDDIAAEAVAPKLAPRRRRRIN